MKRLYHKQAVSAVFVRAGRIIIGCCIVAFVASCTKDDDDPTEEVVNPDYYTLLRVENLPIGPTDEGSEPNEFGFYLYSLSAHKAIPQSEANSTKWDLAFGSDFFTSFLSGNNGSDQTNYGAGNGGLGGIAIIEKSFDDVDRLPADIVFKTGGDVIGTDDEGFFGQGMGWYLYDFNGDIVRDGAEEDGHISYALSEPLLLSNGTIVNPRTVIVKTARGDYAKIKMISCYKDLFKQEQWKKGKPIMYATFEYILIPGDSNTFEIR